MSRYIDVEGFEKLFDEEYKATRELIYQGETHLDNIAEGFSEAAKVIRAIPAADVVEVRHGRWIFYHDILNDPKGYFIRIECSECGLKTGQISNYCPMCGAKMDGERKDDGT